MNEIFKYLNGLSLNLMNEVFRLKSNYRHFRNLNQFETYIPKTTSSLNSSVYRTNKLWQLISHNITNYLSLQQFKYRIPNGITEILDSGRMVWTPYMCVLI